MLKPRKMTSLMNSTLRITFLKRAIEIFRLYRFGGDAPKTSMAPRSVKGRRSLCLFRPEIS